MILSNLNEDHYLASLQITFAVLFSRLRRAASSTLLVPEGLPCPRLIATLVAEVIVSFGLGEHNSGFKFANQSIKSAYLKRRLPPTL